MQPSITRFFKPNTPGADSINGATSPRTINGIKSPLVVKRPVEECPRTPTTSTKREADSGDEDNDRIYTKKQAVESPSVRTFRDAKTFLSSPSIPRTPPTAQRKPFPVTPKTYTPRQVKTPQSASKNPTDNQQGNSGTDEPIKHPHLSYKFLYPPERRDIKKRKPDDPDYDERTLYVPESFLNSQTPALRQWWILKQKNMDTILFFKMGKFYELFNEDAVIGVNNLEINFMKGEGPAHAGFPEVSYDKYADMLVSKGFRVARIEQTETPEMMDDRCQTTGKKGKFDKVVRREICRITTKGTRMPGIMESVFSHSPRNQYLLAIYESRTESSMSEGMKFKIFGVCFIDVTVSKVYFGQFEDDNNLSKLNILLAHHTPTEVIYERNNLDSQTYQALLKTGADLTVLKPAKEFWPIKTALNHLKVHDIFINESGKLEWPELLHKLFEEGESSESLMALEPKSEFAYALNSFGAIVYYLQAQLILKQVLNCTSYQIYQTPLERSRMNLPGEKDIPPMVVDHVALRNLEIFENSSGGTQSTLYESINYCKTHFGQRLLKSWLCSPLCSVEQINSRLDAVEALISNENASLMNEFVHILDQTPDLERMLSKIKSQCFKSESDTRAVMFDSVKYSKAKINSLLNLIQNFKRLQNFICSISRSARNCKSKILKRLLSTTNEDGLFPDYSATLDYFDSLFNQDLARQEGKIIPEPGVDKDYDNCQASIEDIKNKFDAYLEEQKIVLKCRRIEYFGTGKNRYQIQVPDSHCGRVPSEYRIETTRKGVKRYLTPTIDNLFRDLTIHEEEMKRILDRIMSNIFEQFSRKVKLWSSAIECMALLDVLQSIANFVRSLKASGVDVCRPELFDSKGQPIIEYFDGRHPSLVKMNTDYISNNLTLDEKLILLSGANMGGKSTLMRQTALLVILAQIGCFVPATKMRLTPVDRIFSRLGASDRLLEGESTFYTELVETSAMIRCATRDSLLLLDELGRGTSTYDGTAIAYAVLEEISRNIECRCLFSTHYHTLVRDFCNNDKVRLAHMACKVVKDPNAINSNQLSETITFLYKIAEGPVGQSYGFNVAKLAGIDSVIIKEALEKADELELYCKVLETLQKVSINDGTVSKSDLKSRVLAQLAC